MHNLIGIDWSITSPAICIHEGDDWDISNCSFYFYSKKLKTVIKDPVILYPSIYPEWSTQEGRFNDLANWAMCRILKSDQASRCQTRVAIEGYSYGARGRAVFDIPESTGLLKHRLYTNYLHFDTYAPTSIKKFATGKGNSGKDIMQIAFYEETGIDLPSVLNQTTKALAPSSDIIDSYYVAKFLFENIKNKSKKGCN